MKQKNIYVKLFFIKILDKLIGKKMIKIIFLSILLLLFTILINIDYFKKNLKKKKIGIIGLEHSQNVGNNLLKYAISIKLTELGVIPYIIGMRYRKHNISFVSQFVNLRIINKTFSEIKSNDYDILMVNSDQTWRNFKNGNVFDIAFLRFAEKWNIPKFVYAASLGTNKWGYNKTEEEIAKYLLKNFTGISIRESCSINLIKKHFGFKPTFVLDPTLLIDKKYYLNLIKNFKNDKIIDNTYIFIYIVRNNSKEFINIVNNISNKYKTYLINVFSNNQIKKFIYGIYNSKGVVTNSFHGTIFSIIFNKPFISFTKNIKRDARFSSLKDNFNLKNRIIDRKSTPDYNLLEIPLNINKSLLNSLKVKSINFLKKNLGI